VRRAARGVGVAIRKGQAAGEIRSRGQHDGNGVRDDDPNSKPGPSFMAVCQALR